MLLINQTIFLQVFRMFGFKVPDNMETPAILKMERLQKELVEKDKLLMEKDEKIKKLMEEKAKDSQRHQLDKLQLEQQRRIIEENEEKLAELKNVQEKKLVEKDERMTEIENKLEEEKKKNEQIQILQVSQSEEQRKQREEKDVKIAEIENENTKLEEQQSESASIIKVQRQHIDELEKKLLCSSTNEVSQTPSQPAIQLPSCPATQLPTLILSSSPNNSKRSDTGNSHAAKKRHPSVGSKTILSMRPGDRSSLPPSSVPPSHAEETAHWSSPPMLNDQNYPLPAARNRHGKNSAIPSASASPKSPPWTASTRSTSAVYSSPTSSHPAASPSVANSSHPTTNVPDKVIYYTDSNTRMSQHILREKMNEIRKNSGRVPKLEQVPAYTLQKAHKIIQTNNHENAVVIINLMTNNVRRGESPASIRALQEEIIWMLKSETAPQNIIFVESPPSLKFDTASYNASTQSLCKRMNVRFSWTLIRKGHLNKDGYHVRYEHQHLMQRTLAAAILNVVPFKAFNLRPNSRGFLGPYSTS